ncbi:MAG: 4Fe-4S binding protein [Desulfobacteraceae bacterium]|nr:4Fe-4S binding protein [Desulfobacteraceae bacterium]
MIWEALETDFYPPELPDIWIDRLAVIAIFIGIWFLIRRISIPQIRKSSSAFDYIFIIIATLPFISGYYLVSGTPDIIFFLDNDIWNIHIISGEVFILCAAFLLCSTRINPDKCIGCASCELACPTETLETIDKDDIRTFKYSHYQCICCGSCINACPEDAVELRHNMNLLNFFKVNIKNIIRTAKLKRCIRCSKTFTPEPVFDKVVIELNHDYLKLCPECRKHDHAENFLK